MTVSTNETRFLLDNAGEAWRVVSGCADLYLVNVRGDGSTGPLFYLCTIEAGDSICGVGRAESPDGNIGILCLLRASAELTRVAPSPELAARVRRALLSLDEAEPDDRVEQGAEFLLLQLAARRASAEAMEAERLRRKDDADTATFRRAVSQLTAGLEKREAPIAVHDFSGSPVFSACAAVGKQQGIEMRRPKHFTASRDAISDVQAIARASNVRSRQVSLAGEWWRKDHGSLLAFQSSPSGEAAERAVALIRKGERYFVYDPELRTTERLTQATAAAMLPTATMFYRPFPARPLTWKDLLLFGLFDTKRDIAWIVLTGIAGGLLALVAPIATGILFDTIIPGAQRNQLVQMAALLFAANMVTFLISLTSSAAMQRMESRMETGIQSAVWDRLLSLPARFFKEYNSGDLVSRSLTIGEIRKMLTGTALGSMMSGIFSVFSFFLLFHYSSTLAWVAAALTVFTALTSALCSWLQMRYLRDLYKISLKLSGLVLEIMSGISKLRMSGTERQAFARWAEPFSAQKSILRKSQRISLFAAVFNGVFPTVAALAIFYFGFAMMEGQGSLTPGSFVAFNAAFGQFLGAALGLSSTLISVIGIVPAYEQARPIMEAVPETRAGRVDPGRLSGAIEANRLTFRYKPELPLVLHDVSFSIRPGQFVAFVGHSGSGKSTLFRLLLGFEEAESGFMHFDNIDLRDIDPLSLRKQMGVVLQNGRIFDGDIFTNIVGSAPLTMDDAWAAARASGLDKDIQEMPMGMHTVISEGGGGFSGGQRQRLLIARAIIQKPRILLFDEATSALDNHTQAVVSRSLEQLNATRIVIAHRLSTIIHADQILVFDEGRIVQRGTYAELMEQEGLFRELAKRQIA